VTQCDPSEATWQLINSIVLEDRNRGINKIMFFGGGCSLATEPLAALAGRFYRIPMVRDTHTLSKHTMYMYSALNYPMYIYTKFFFLSFFLLFFFFFFLRI